MFEIYTRKAIEEASMAFRYLARTTLAYLRTIGRKTLWKLIVVGNAFVHTVGLMPSFMVTIVVQVPEVMVFGTVPVATTVKVTFCPADKARAGYTNWLADVRCESRVNVTATVDATADLFSRA